MADWNNSNDVIGDVAYRAKALCNMKIDELRQLASSDEEGRLNAARQEFIDHTKGDLVEHILVEEFTEEFPADLIKFTET